MSRSLSIVIVVVALVLAATPARADQPRAVDEAAARMAVSSGIAARAERRIARLERLRYRRMILAVAGSLGVSPGAAEELVERAAAAGGTVFGPEAVRGIFADAAVGVDVAAGSALTDRLAALEAEVGAGNRELEDAEVEVVRVLLGRAPERFAPEVARWRPLVRRYFPPPLVDDALAVLRCESGGDPTARNPRSSAAGLFQFLRRTWRWVTAAAGSPSADPTDPEANVAAAAWLVRSELARGEPPWGQWSCRP